VRVLAIGAHPDDLVILCGGTVARYAAAGHEVTMVDVTRGDRGSFVHTSEEIARIRTAESTAAAERIGATYRGLGLSDGEVFSQDRAQRMMIVDLVRETRPDVILTHSPNDYMADHNEVSRLVFDASFLATLPLLETSIEAHGSVTPLFYLDTLGGLGFAPTEWVDISATIEQKLDMMRAHASQLTWLRDHDGVDVVEQVRTTAAYRGGQAGVAYAEAFRASDAWLRVRTTRLLP
jgi:LmbE family N-acetylglucosaminyl deacetylase